VTHGKKNEEPTGFAFFFQYAPLIHHRLRETVAGNPSFIDPKIINKKGKKWDSSKYI